MTMPQPMTREQVELNFELCLGDIDPRAKYDAIVVLLAHDALQREALAQAEQRLQMVLAVNEENVTQRSNLQDRLADSEQQVARLREALEAITRRAPTMGANGEYRDGQLSALEACRKVAQAALVPEADQ